MLKLIVHTQFFQKKLVFGSELEFVLMMNNIGVISNYGSFILFRQYLATYYTIEETDFERVGCFSAPSWGLTRLFSRSKQISSSKPKFQIRSNPGFA